MKQKKLPTRVSRGLGAALLSAATLWTVCVTAGSTDAAGAWQSLKQELPLALLRWQLGDPGQPDGLSTAAVLTLSQSPLLLSARQEIAGLRQQAEEDILRLLEGCDLRQLQILQDVLRAVKESLDLRL